VECDVPPPEGINEKFYLGAKKADKCLHIAFAKAMMRGLDIKVVTDDPTSYRIYDQPKDGHKHAHGHNFQPEFNPIGNGHQMNGSRKE
jgi:hypothetical protein